MGNQPEKEQVDALREALGEKLASYRKASEVGQLRLARVTNYHRSSISHIEAGRQFPDREFWEIADRECRANGALLAEYECVCDRLTKIKLTELRLSRPGAMGHDHGDMSIRSSDLGMIWTPSLVTIRATELTFDDMAVTRRGAIIKTSAALVGSALTQPLQQWLLSNPAIGAHSSAGSNFDRSELDSLEGIVRQFRSWTSAGNGALARKAVIAQLNDVADRLRDAPDGAATKRAFRIASELVKIIASMSWDLGLHRAAQDYYLTAVQLANFTGDNALAAVSLAAMARQCYELGNPADGLEIVQLAQYGTRRGATPRFRSMLATREAWAYAQMGQVAAFRRAVGLAEDHFSDGASDRDPRTVRNFDMAELSGVIGARYRDLALHDPKQARRAIEYIENALRQRHPTRTRNRVFDLIGLARANLIGGDLDRASDSIGQAIPIAKPWLNGRVGAKLQDFQRESARFGTVRTIRDTREMVRAALVA
jgi:tetratricopeptide (TPR) repeat protein/DNA-binding XRE family transcriptional regulator